MLSAKDNSARPNNLAYLRRDRGYRFLDRDPELEEVCSIVSKSGLSSAEISSKITQLSKSSASVAPTTIDNWLSGKTKRPQNYTLTWVMSALGYERKWRKIRGV